MSVVTISRGSFSGGKSLAVCLAQRLGYRCVDRDVIVEKAAASGVSQKEIRDAILLPPTFLERFTHKKYLYLTLIQAALTDELRTGKVVYHGNAGHLLLPGGAPMVRVRIIAPMSYRIGMARERLRMTEPEAIEYIHKRDGERRKWTQYLYGVDWTDPALYDLVINLEHVSITEACRMLEALIRVQACYEFGPECRSLMDDLATASRVKAKLAMEPATAHLEFDVGAKGGQVYIHGKLPSMDLLPRIERIAGGVMGVEKVDLREVAPASQL